MGSLITFVCTSVVIHHPPPATHSLRPPLSLPPRPSSYNASNHWSALTDGSVKYIFHALTGNEQVGFWLSFPRKPRSRLHPATHRPSPEQLFNLTADPDERYDLAWSSADLQSTVDALAIWRGRLAAQFQDEGRGTDWVTEDGDLVLRPVSTTYSPYYPSTPL